MQQWIESLQRLFEDPSRKIGRPLLDPPLQQVAVHAFAQQMDARQRLVVQRAAQLLAVLPDLLRHAVEFARGGGQFAE